MWQTKAVLLTHFLACSAPPPPPLPAPAQQLLPVDPVDRRDWEDYGFDQDVPGSPPSDVDIDIALAALLKGLPGINAEEFDDLLKDLPMPEPGAKGGISVKEAAEVCFICYIVCYIIFYITCYHAGYAAWPFARDGQGSARSFHCKRTNYARFC